MNKSKANKMFSGLRIGVFGKGGAGKSTFTALLATALRGRGYPVFVLNADSTNVGLPEALGMVEAPQPLLDYYGGMVFSGGRVTCPVDDPTPLEHAEVTLEELPAQYYRRNAAGVVLLCAGKIGGYGPGAGCDGPISKIARDFAVLPSTTSPIATGEGTQPVTLVDFKAGFEDTARGALTRLDWAFVTVDPTTASLAIASNMRDMITKIKEDVLPATAHLESAVLIALANRIFVEARIDQVYFVLNRIPNPRVEDFLREKLAAQDIEPVGSIREDPAIPLAWLEGHSLPACDALQDVEDMLDRMVQPKWGHDGP